MQRIPYALFVLMLLMGISAILMAAPAAKQVGTAVTVAVSGLHCAASEKTLTAKLAKLDGVSAVKITRAPDRVTATLDESKTSLGKFVGAIESEPSMANPEKNLAAKVLVILTAKGQTPAALTKALKGVTGVKGVGLAADGKQAALFLNKGADVTTADLTRALTATHATVSFTGAVASGHQSAGGCGGKGAAKSGACSMMAGKAGATKAGCKMDGAKAGATKGDCKMSDCKAGASKGDCKMSDCKAGATKGNCKMGAGKAGATKAGCKMDGTKAGATKGSCKMGGGKAAAMKGNCEMGGKAAASSASCDMRSGTCSMDGAPAAKSTGGSCPMMNGGAPKAHCPKPAAETTTTKP